MALEQNKYPNLKSLNIEFGQDSSNQYFAYMQESNSAALSSMDKYFDELEAIHVGATKMLYLYLIDYVFFICLSQSLEKDR